TQPGSPRRCFLTLVSRYSPLCFTASWPKLCFAVRMTCNPSSSTLAVVTSSEPSPLTRSIAHVGQRHQSQFLSHGLLSQAPGRHSRGANGRTTAPRCQSSGLDSRPSGGDGGFRGGFARS